MYLQFNKDIITRKQLIAIMEILELDNINDIDWFTNIHYQTCRYEIECAIENMLGTEELNEFKASEDYEEKIERWTSMLYYSSDYHWEQLYDKAETIIEL